VTMIWISAILATLLSVGVSVAIGLFSPSSRASKKDEYQLAARNVSATNYATASVGYALQMAAVFLFAYWGFRYGYGALWTVLFWFLGYGVLYFLLPRFVPYLAGESPRTLHEHLRAAYGDSRLLQFLAAGATILGLLGAMIAEVDYTTQIYNPLLASKPPLIKLALEAFFLITGLCYVVFYGLKAEVNTERWQVPIAYAGFLLALFFSFPAVWVESGRVTFAKIAWALLLTLLIIVVAKINFRGGRERKWRVLLPDGQIAIPFIAIVLLIAEWQWLRLSHAPGPNSGILDEPLGEQLRAQGLLGVASLFFANVFWMPVDLSTWQRLASIDTRGGGEVAFRRLREGTWRVLFESPASWCLGVVLGWTIRAARVLLPGDDASEGLKRFSTALAEGRLSLGSSTLGSVGYFFFVASCVAVMLSTISSLLVAISYTAERDFLPLLTKGSSNSSSLKSSRLLSVAIVVVGFAVYEFMRRQVGANLQTLLYGAYAAQLALVVIVLFMLFGRRKSRRAAIVSLLFGFSATVLSTFLAIKTGSDDFAVLPPLCAVFGALAGYLFAYRQSDEMVNAA